MAKLKFTDILAVISALGMLGLLTTQFFGGMFIWTISYPLIIFPLVILYIVSFFNTLIAFINKGIVQNKVKALSHSIVILVIVLFEIYQSDLFKSEKIMTARMNDDLFSYTLILREDGSCENEVNGFMGFNQNFKGQYIFKGDTVIFSKVPYDNKGFIPDTILVNKAAGAIFIEKDTMGNFSIEKEWLNHFKIIDSK